MSAPATPPLSVRPPRHSAAGDFFAGIGSAWTSVFFLVIGGTYIGIGALAHDFGIGAWPAGGAHSGLDGLDQGIAGIDVDTRLLV